MDRGDAVAIVFVPDFAERLASLAASSHVWIVRTTENEAAVLVLWSGASPKYSLTLFVLSGADPVADSIDDIELHHGEASGRNISRVRVIGAEPTEEAERKLRRIGLPVIVPAADGFTARPR